MPTNCTISKLEDGGLVRSIMCQMHGGLRGVGFHLHTSYRQERLVDKLLALGDLWVLGQKIEPDKKDKHTFMSPQENVTFSYSRDKGLKHAMVVYDSVITFQTSQKFSETDLNYMWIEGTWYLFSKETKKWISVESQLMQMYQLTA